MLFRSVIKSLKTGEISIGSCGGDFLRVYENKEELKTEIHKTFEKYIAEFDNIPENLKDKLLYLLELSERKLENGRR